MFRWIVRRRLAAFEREFGYDATYVRDVLDASALAMWRFYPIGALSNYRQGILSEPWHAAKIAATLSEDCGPCTQLMVTMAERDGMSPATIRAVLAGDVTAMGPDASLGYKFAIAVIERDISEADRLRAEILTRWGKQALVSLTLTIAASRVYPIVKYGLGHGRACTRIRVAGADEPIAARVTHV